MNILKEKIRDDKFVSVLWGANSPDIVGKGWKDGNHDGVFADGEHDPGMDPRRLLHLRNGFMAMQAQEAKSVEFGVRVPKASRTWIQHLSDGGVSTFVFPMVNMKEQAQKAVSLLLYPPDGVRGGAGSMPANCYGNDRDYYKQANANTCVIVQAETPESLPNLVDIVSVPGVDMVFIGPFDMHITHRLGFRTGDPELEATIQRRVRETRASVPSARFGIMEPRANKIQEWRNAGFSLFAVPVTVLIDRAFAQHSTSLAQFRGQ